MSGIVLLFIAGGVALFVLFTITWLVQLRTKNAAIVDAVWAASFPLLALIYFFTTEGYERRKQLLLALVIFWGMRLALHLLVRTVGHPEDVRYAALRKEWGERQSFLMLRFFYFQAILALILSLPFAFIMMNQAIQIGTIEIAGSALLFLAVVGESAADQQLKKFKANPTNKGKVCDTGLWRYSRHPNYFFEWLVWVAFFLMALGSPFGYISIICPVLMYFFLTKVTGIAYTEAQMLKSKGDVFAEYQRTTSAFFPMAKRQ